MKVQKELLEIPHFMKEIVIKNDISGTLSSGGMLMNSPYHCPNCKTNKTRFNIIEQHPRIVKLDAHTGDVISEHTPDNIEPFHMVYKGPSMKVQCGVCGLLEDENMFVKYAHYTNGKENL